MSLDCYECLVTSASGVNVVADAAIIAADTATTVTVDVADALLLIALMKYLVIAQKM